LRLSCRRPGSPERGEEPRFAVEPREPLRVGRERVREDLHRDVASERRVAGLPHDAHPALADLLGKAVATERLSGGGGQSILSLARRVRIAIEARVYGARGGQTTLFPRLGVR
jgi:hypothetical protein